MNARGGRPLAAFSNARGVVRYFVTTRPDARTGALSMVECRSATAHTVIGLTLIPGPAVPQKRPSATRPATIADIATTARFGVLPGTPAGFNVTQASDAQLARLGYPFRPDQRLHPAAYAIWHKLVTTPGAYVPSARSSTRKCGGRLCASNSAQTHRRRLLLSRP
jgi:hypothetical protein